LSLLGFSDFDNCSAPCSVAIEIDRYIAPESLPDRDEARRRRFNQPSDVYAFVASVVVISWTGLE
jgi:hypothetical protein